VEIIEIKINIFMVRWGFNIGFYLIQMNIVIIYANFVVNGHFMRISSADRKRV